MIEPQLDFKTLFQRFSEPPAPEPDPTPCDISGDFTKKLEEVLFQPLGRRPSRGQLAQAKYLLQEEWHAWRKALPPSHLRAGWFERRHACLDEAYHVAYDRLQLLELTLRPPELIADYEELLEQARARDAQPVVEPAPVPSSPPPPEQIFGVGIGQVIDIDPEP